MYKVIIRQKLMGNAFSFTSISHNEIIANNAINAAIEEVTRIEDLLSTYKSSSITSLINDNAGLQPIEVPTEVFQLISRANTISKITQGAFDISYGSVDKSLWNFDKNMTALPSKEVAKKSVYLVNWQNIILDETNQTVFLKNKGMRIGFGGIGKGYAAEKAKHVMINMGIENGVVNAAGDMTVWGNQEDGGPWTIAIADPNFDSKILANMQLENQSIATSGDYEKYAVIDGQRYSHTIDPKTGLPTSGIKSVTIIAPNAELADALTTPTMIMGVDAGLHLINQLHDVETIIMDDKNKIYLSNNIKIS